MIVILVIWHTTACLCNHVQTWESMVNFLLGCSLRPFATICAAHQPLDKHDNEHPPLSLLFQPHPYHTHTYSSSTSSTTEYQHHADLRKGEHAALVHRTHRSSPQCLPRLHRPQRGTPSRGRTHGATRAYTIVEACILTVLFCLSSLLLRL